MLRITFVFLTLLLGIGCQPNVPNFKTSELSPGGKLTTRSVSQRTFIAPGKGVDKKEQLEFWTGFSLARDPWVIAPSSTSDRDGLGPLFNTRSCISCHSAGSRAKIDEPGLVIPTPLVVRLSSTDPTFTDLDPNYGGQIQPRGINVQYAGMADVPQGEAWLDFNYTIINGEYADGTSYQLQQPHYALDKLQYGPLAPHIGLSPRFAPNIYGMGLLDAISIDDLLIQEDVDDQNQDGISARYNRVPDLTTNRLTVGRFGFKAKHPNLRQQVAAAFRDDIGITSTLFPNESCTPAQTVCLVASQRGGAPNIEIPDDLLTLVTKFNQYLAVPPARGLTDSNTQAGRTIFFQLGCHTCHTPKYITQSDYPLKALAGQTIWPYSDLALHDMGPALSDDTIEFDANKFEWRTPPLWGIGLQAKYVGQQRFLHDGRARTLSEAIIWHGGEAKSSRDKFLKLSKSDRDKLIQFLRSI